MREKMFLLIILLTGTIMMSSQNRVDSITQIKVKDQMRYQQAGKLLNAFDMNLLLSKNNTSLRYYRSSRSLSGFADAFCYTGGFCMGYPIGYAIAGAQMNWSLFAVGCGFVMLAVPIYIAGNHKLKMAVDIYNNNLNPRSEINSWNVKLGYTQNGIGLTMTL